MTTPSPAAGTHTPQHRPTDPTAARPVRPTRPGWIEIAAAAATYGALFLVARIVLHHIPDTDTVISGLVAYALSALLGLCAFAAAWSVRIRHLPAFGVRRVGVTWLLAGAGLGVVAVLVSNLTAFFLAHGATGSVQAGYHAASSGGPLALIATLLLGAVATPVGEELAFRGVLTNALGHYGSWVAVPASSLVFALAHGINAIMVVAFVNGVISAMLFRKTRSIWPGVMVHLVNNGWATLWPVILAALTR